MENKKNRTYFGKRALFWLIIFSLFGILYGFVQTKFPEFKLLHNFSFGLGLISWLVFAYYCIRFNMTNIFTTLFEFKFKKK